MPELYIGLMSGTSLDGVDGVLVDFAPQHPQVLQHAGLPFPADLAASFLALNASGADELHHAALAANRLAELYARVVAALLHQAQVPASSVRAIGAHGQTVRHRPGEFDGVGYTLQLNQPALLAERCGIDVVADFRSRDVAAGGQGAPLVPPFHAAFFGLQRDVGAVLNIGGIANVSILRAGAADTVVGFDCGPGNALMDAWCLRHTGARFDAGGAWAASGQVQEALLARLMDEPFFRQPPPKSTGRDLFNAPWLHARLAGFESLAPRDVQATLAELTARVCAHNLQTYAPGCQSLLVCGGGALNLHLMRRLQVALPDCAVAASDAHGIPPLQVEACAFAWLARQAMLRQTASLKSVTGARGARILGAIYPA